MRPFQQFRFWARRAPLRERAGAGMASLVALALVAWLLVPSGDDPSADEIFASGPGSTETPLSAGAPHSGADAPGSGEGSDSATLTGRAGGNQSGATPGGGDGVPGATPERGGSGTGDATGEECVSPPGSARGITDDEVKVAVVLTNLVIGSAANSLFDVATPAEAKADYEAVIAGINRDGGVACRKLVARYFEANPADESQMMSLCREIADSDLYAVADTGSLAIRPAVLACFGQRKVPYFGAFFITEEARREFFPYLYSFYTKDHVYSATAFGLASLGFFDPAQGFDKLGFIYRDCEREAIDSFRQWIREAGVPDSKVVPYSVGCPSVFASEADLAQAVLEFKGEGVTHVIAANFTGDLARFADHAEPQGFDPQYGLPDEAYLSTAEGSRAPDPRKIANALAITLGRDAEQHTPGLSPTPGTERCNAYYRAAGQPPVYEQNANAGHACDQLWMLDEALSRAPDLSPTALPVGLQATKSIDFSFPQGPNDFTGSGVTTGGQFWRVAQVQPNCNSKCWRVIQPEFRRGWI